MFQDGVLNEHTESEDEGEELIDEDEFEMQSPVYGNSQKETQPTSLATSVLEPAKESMNEALKTPVLSSKMSKISPKAATTKMPQKSPLTEEAHPKDDKPVVKKPPVDKSLVCIQDIFTLRKFNVKPQTKIDDSKVPKHVIKTMEKLNKDSSVFEIDLEKAVMLANVQGNVLNLNLNNGTTGPPVNQMENEKEHFHSCYITGMKAYFKSLKVRSEKMARIEKELDHSETKRSDIKRVLMRFQKEQMLGYRLDQA